MKQLQRKYGLLTAICMVVGTVIGSGLFFKAQSVLQATNGDMTLGVLSWIITGFLMLVCATQFAIMATKFEKINGVVDYAEATCGKGFAYYLAWFMITVYYPAMTSVLAWVSARYFGVLFGWDLASSNVMVLAGCFLICSFALNALSPKLAGKFQVGSTAIKLIPIILMAVVGTVVGLANGTLTDNFTDAIVNQTVGQSSGISSGLFAAIVATVFAYEGWIVATSINAELKNSKRNLPLALIFGSAIVVLAYVFYFVGVAGGASTSSLISDGATKAFSNVFGKVGGTLLNICIVVSCLGTLNGLMVAATRGIYSMAVRDEGPAPKTFRQVDDVSNMTTNSSVFGLLTCSFWLVYFFGANLSPEGGWFGLFNFDSSELPIITIYAFYIPMIIMWMIKQKDETPLRRFVIPILSILSCAFMIFAAIYAHGITPYKTAKAAGEFAFPVLFYLIVFAVIMFAGIFFSPAFRKKMKKQDDLSTSEEE